MASTEVISNNVRTIIGSFVSEKRRYEASKTYLSFNWSEKPLWRSVFRPFKGGDPNARALANAVLRVHGRGSFLTENLIAEPVAPSIECDGSAIHFVVDELDRLLRSSDDLIAEWQSHLVPLEAKISLTPEDQSLSAQLGPLKARVAREGNVKTLLKRVFDSQRLAVLHPARPGAVVHMHTVPQAGLGEDAKDALFVWLKQATREVSLDRLLISAPEGAWNEEGQRPNPLPRDLAREFDKNKGRIPPDDCLAWRTLLLSWNVVFPSKKVPIKEKSNDVPEDQTSRLLSVIEQQAESIRRLEEQVRLLTLRLAAPPASQPVATVLQPVPPTIVVDIEPEDTSIEVEAAPAPPSVRPEVQEERRGNPVKPRSDSLPAEIRSLLREYFKLDTLPPREVFASLSKEEKKKVSKRTSIPHFAVSGYNLYGQTFLDALVKGEVTGKTFSEWCKGRVLPANATSHKSAYTRLQQKWKMVKDANKGVPLVNNPSSAAERRLYNAYLRIRDKFRSLSNKDRSLQPFLPVVGRRLSLGGLSTSKERKLASLVFNE